jgi:hypothetical protein
MTQTPNNSSFSDEVRRTLVLLGYTTGCQSAVWKNNVRLVVNDDVDSLFMSYHPRRGEPVFVGSFNSVEDLMVLHAVGARLALDPSTR